jgi:broad specificity phosphatase PhoE
VTDIVLVRHGETTWHAENRYAGGSDVPLAESGIEQARVLTRWAGSAGLAGVWSSDLTRSRLTAQPCADAIGRPLRIDARLREIDFGQGEGLTRDEMERLMPAELAAFQRDPVAHHLPGGEDPNAAAARGLACLHDIAAADVEGRILVVGHGTLIRLMYCALLGVPLGEYRRLFPYVRNGHLNEIRLRAGQAAILSWNAPPTPSGDPVRKGGRRR